MMHGILLDPLDTLFFRDGTEFSSESAVQIDVGGLFPPSPSGIVGALRAALARANGWDGRGRWGREVSEVLGDGPEDMGSLRTAGPFLVRDGEPLFPMPRHVLGVVEGGRWVPRILLSPGPEVECDLGTVRLPELPGGPPKGRDEVPGPAEGLWLTLPGMEAVCRGRLPARETVVDAKDLWSVERRVGIGRDRKMRTVAEGKLFSTLHVRPAPGVALGAVVTGLPPGWRVPESEVVTVGGEARLAGWSRWEGPFSFGRLGLDHLGNSRRLALVALTPLDAGEELGAGRPVPGLDGLELVSVCSARPGRIGGWNSLERAPVPLRAFLPAGSVLFCEVREGEAGPALPTGECGFLRAGSRTAQGYGVMLVMAWPENREVEA